MVSEKVASVRETLAMIWINMVKSASEDTPDVGIIDSMIENLRDIEEQVRQMETNLIAPEPEIETVVGLEASPPEAA